MKKIVLHSITLVILSIIFLPKLLDLYNNFSCEISGKKYLEKANNKKECIKITEFDDAGKECHLAGECKGRCIWIPPTPIYEKTPTSEGYYYSPQKEYKGVCSKYDLLPNCYKNLPGLLDSSGYSLDNSGKPSDTIFICPPPST